MSEWTPKRKGDIDVTKLKLSAEEGFVLSRIDGATSVKDIQHLTGFSEEKVSAILCRLVDEGAVQKAPAKAGATLEGLERIDDELDDDGLATLQDGAPLGESAATVQDEDEPLFPDEEADDDEAPPVEAQAEEDDNEDDDDEAEPEDPATQGAYRQLFEERFHPLPRDERAALARKVEGAELCALCFDPDPAVIRAVLENLKTGLEHARLIAAHHRSSVGLDAMSQRAHFLRDAQVQRHLLRNVQTPDGVLRRMLQGKPLIHLFKLNKSREATERAKRNIRQAFRRSFQRASAEERVGLIFSTEGRCLNALIGLSFDAKTTALLCGRTYHSTLLIQNLARFAATPPNVLIHLAKQPAVRRAPHLKQILLQHPNCPAQLKRMPS